MPKTIKNIYDNSVSFENLLKAHKKARCGKREKKKIILFELKLEQELLELEKQLKNGTYKHGGYTKFKIYEPKERIIMASEYKDRVVHQWYVEKFIKPYFVPQFISTSYAGIEGRGMHKASKDVQKAMRSAKSKWKNYYILKMDVTKYFQNIDKRILWKILKRKMKDKKLLWLTREILLSTEGMVGLPIGNTISYYLPKFFDMELRKNANVSENTIISYKYAFVSLLQFVNDKYKKEISTLELKDLNKETIEKYLEYLEKEKNNSISTINQRLAAIKSFFNYLTIEDIEYISLCNEIHSIKIKKTKQETIKYLSKEGIKEILSLPKTSIENGVRDLAILTLLYDSGARVQELVNIKTKDIDFNKKTVYLFGKGRKARIVPLISQTIKILEKYIKIYNIPINSDNLLFYNSQKEALTRMGITYIIKKYVSIARNKNPLEFQINVTPHTFRHSKAMHLLESGVNLIYIRDFLGHESVTTTEIYARANPENKRKAIEKHSEELSKMVHYSSKEKNDLLNWLKNSLKENSRRK